MVPESDEVAPAEAENLLAALQAAVPAVAAWAAAHCSALKERAKGKREVTKSEAEAGALQAEVQAVQGHLVVAAAAAATARAPFQWVDGPLITAMRQGDIILVDEINLAEDAVLERLNRWASWQLLSMCVSICPVNQGAPGHDEACH